MSELVVQGCTITASVDSIDGVLTCVPSVSPSKQPSINCLVSNKGIYFEKVVAQITSATIVATTPPEGAISPIGIFAGNETIDIEGTADYILENGKKAVQKGDKGEKDIEFLFQTAVSGSPIPKTFTVKVEVTDSGQADVVAL